MYIYLGTLHVSTNSRNTASGPVGAQYYHKTVQSFRYSVNSEERQHEHIECHSAKGLTPLPPVATCYTRKRSYTVQYLMYLCHGSTKYAWKASAESFSDAIIWQYSVKSMVVLLERYPYQKQCGMCLIYSHSNLDWCWSKFRLFKDHE